MPLERPSYRLQASRARKPNRPRLLQLLRAVDCMPLPVSLLAQLAQQGNPPSQLLLEWGKSKSRLLRTETNGREYNVEVSIKISLDFLPHPEVDAEPLQLLSVCSQLADGIFPPVVSQLQPHFVDLDGAARLLKRHALVSVGPAGELKMLSPVREYILRSHPMAEQACHRTAGYLLCNRRRTTSRPGRALPRIVLRSMRLSMATL